MDLSIPSPRSGNVWGGCGDSIAETVISFARRQPPIRPVLNALVPTPVRYMLIVTVFLKITIGKIAEKMKSSAKTLK